MTNVTIVTDTSADLTPELAEAQDIRQVPLSVSFGDESFAAGNEAAHRMTLTTPPRR